MKLALGFASTFAVLGLASAAVAGPLLSNLETTVQGPDGHNFSVWLGPAYFNAPAANGLGAVIDDGPFNFLQQPDDGAALTGLGGSGGVSLSLPVAGHEFFVSVDGDFARLTRAGTVVVANNSSFIDVLPINGDPSTGAAFTASAGDIVNNSSMVSFTRGTAELGVVVANADQFALVVGGLGSFSSLHLTSAVTPVGGAPTTGIFLDEKVTTTSAGPVLSAQYERPVKDGASLLLGGRAAVLWAHGELTGSQTASRPGNPSWMATDSASALAGLVEANVGVKFALNDSLALVVSGGGSARNDYFSIVNPRSAPGLVADNPASYDPGPASLRQSIIVAARASVGLIGHF